MRRFLLIASAAAIALVGLSANQCGGGEDKQAAPESPPAEAPASPPSEPATPPAESPPPAETPAPQP